LTRTDETREKFGEQPQTILPKNYDIWNARIIADLHKRCILSHWTVLNITKASMISYIDMKQTITMH